MSIASGTKLGPYEIVAPIGAGGMGEVYRARDTRLGRDVALKVLPEAFARDAERMARLRREAQVLASLNHANIAAIYGFEDSGNVHALVMELVEGPTLAERIKTGAIPLDEALPVAKQICEAVEYAHERGIIHRDLKPSNVKVTPDGQVKVLDFGLAKAIEGDPSTTSVENSPTLSAMATHAGFLLGTAAYMSPEQARGKKADRRADIWAFGVVLFEMLRGERLFTGETISDTLAAVIRGEPDWNELPAATPPKIRELLQRCLKKDPRQRLQSIGDARIAIDEVLSGTPQDSSPSTVVAEPLLAPLWRRALPWVIAAALVTILAATIFFLYSPGAPPVEVGASILVPGKTDFMLMEDDAAGPVVISPDGTNIAFVARDEQGRSRIWVRALSGGEARPLSGTEEATYPFWSPDGKWLGFFAGSKLKKAPIETGPVIELTDAVRGRGGSWGPNNTILFVPSPTSPVYAVSAAGGATKPVTTINPAMHTTHRWPHWLSDGKRFLYLATAHGNAAASQNNGIYLGSLDGKENRMLLPSESSAALAPGYLLFLQSSTLMAQPFNEQRGALSGDPMPVAQDVSYNPGTWRGAFDVSGSGILVYQSGGSSQQSELLWQSPGGKPPTKAVEGSDRYRLVELSPDGRKLAVTLGQPRTELWLLDIARDVKTRFTFSGNGEAFVSAAVWAPDGERIAFSEVSPGESNIYVKEAGGSGKQEVLVSSGPTVLNTVDDWSQDGQYLLYHAASIAPVTPLSLYVFPRRGDKKPHMFLSASPYTIVGARFSPDGKWVAYLSNESSRYEAYVTSFPDANGKWQISADGADAIRWFPNGQALLYSRTDGAIVKVPFLAHGNNADLGAPQTYVTTRRYRISLGDTWDIAADGRVIVNSPLGEDTHTIEVVVGWTAKLKRK